MLAACIRAGDLFRGRESAEAVDDSVLLISHQILVFWNLDMGSFHDCAFLMVAAAPVAVQEEAEEEQPCLNGMHKAFVIKISKAISICNESKGNDR